MLEGGRPQKIELVLSLGQISTARLFLQEKSSKEREVSSRSTLKLEIQGIVSNCRSKIDTKAGSTVRNLEIISTTE